MPVTSFKIEYPSEFSAQFNNTDNYLTLTAKNDSGYIQQELALGKLQGIQTTEQIKRWTLKADSMFNIFKTYKTSFIGYEVIGNKNRFVAKGTCSFDGFGVRAYKGYYNVLVLLVASDKRDNGVALTYISRLDSDNIADKNIVDNIISSLEFY